MTASQANQWHRSASARTRPSITAGLTFAMFLALGAVLYYGDDSIRALTAAVTAIVAAAIMIMIADGAAARERGDRGFWLGIGSALSLRATAASIAAIALADHTLDADKQAALLGFNGLAALMLVAVLLRTSVPRNRSWALLLLDAALVAVVSCLSFSITLAAVGRAPETLQWQMAVGLTVIGLDGTALLVLGTTTWPSILKSSVARWLLAGWAVTIISDAERALALTASVIDAPPVYLLSALSAFTLGVAGVLRLTSDSTFFDRMSVESADAVRVGRKRLSIIVVAIASCLFVTVLILVELRGDAQEKSLIAGLAAAGAVAGLLRLTVSTAGQAKEVVKLRERQAELEQQAMTDSITELPNHRALLSRLTEEVERAKRFKQPLSVCFVDVDAFKQINDTLGHQIGDEVLKEIGTILRANARQIDIVARYGGEEFVILLPGTWTDDALLFAERLREAIAITVIRPHESIEVRLSVSIGVAGLPEHADDREALLKRADDAVYIAKRSGRNQVHLYNPSILPGTSGAFTTGDALRLVSVVEQRQTMSSGHGEQVAHMAALMATRLGLDAREIDRVYQAGLLHDLGKISVPDSILSKIARLTSREAEIMRGHSLIGARLLDGNPMLVPLSSAVRHHHERWDGSGYPYRLAGENIPLAARILAIAEAYSAMTSDSPWSRAISSQDALDEITTMAGRQFDPKLVDLFSRIVGQTTPVNAR